MAISNARRKLVRELHQRKGRRKYGAFLVEGLVNVAEVLDSPLSVQEVFATPAAMVSLRQNLPHGSETATPVFTEVNNTELQRLCVQRSPHGAVAMVSVPEYSLQPSAKRLLYLDGLGDPGNVGTLIRTADWFGVDAVLCSPGTVAWYNPKVVAAARGSLFRLTHLQISPAELSALLPQHTWVAADLHGQPVASFAWPDLHILCIGAESHGISAEVSQLAPKLITIPRAAHSAAESLNAGVAGAILLASQPGFVL